MHTEQPQVFAMPYQVYRKLGLSPFWDDLFTDSGVDFTADELDQHQPSSTEDDRTSPVDIGTREYFTAYFESFVEDITTATAHGVTDNATFCRLTSHHPSLIRSQIPILVRLLRLLPSRASLKNHVNGIL